MLAADECVAPFISRKHSRNHLVTVKADVVFSMASRHADWMKQGRRDLDHGRHSLDVGDYEWACFAAQQGAEEAVKAVIVKAGGEASGHSVTALLEALPESLRSGQQLVDVAKALDKHYIPTRYPNSHPQGAPFEYYTRSEAECALTNSARVIDFCEGVLAGPFPADGSSQSSGQDTG